MLASELIDKALRLINVPGQGATLSGPNKLGSFGSLQDILNSKAVSKQFVPGIRQHFFEVAPGAAIMSYGPGQTLDTDDFYDPAPVKIEYAQIRSGSAITRNEKLDEWNFQNIGDWSVGSNHLIGNGKLTASTVGGGSTRQTVSLTTGIEYTLRIEVVHRSGALDVDVWDGSGQLVNQTITGSGVYEFKFIPTAGSQAHYVITTGAGNDLDVLSYSVIATGLDRVSLPRGQGSDFRVKVVDQFTYNSRNSKGHGGRPYQLLYSRGFPYSEISFDNTTTVPDILLLDVLVNRIGVTSLSDVIRLHPEAIRYVKYALADEEAGGYGKALTPRQITIMNEAEERLMIGNRRINNLRVDLALQSRRDFDINRGDT